MAIAACVDAERGGLGQLERDGEGAAGAAPRLANGKRRSPAHYLTWQCTVARGTLLVSDGPEMTREGSRSDTTTARVKGSRSASRRMQQSGRQVSANPRTITLSDFVCRNAGSLPRAAASATTREARRSRLALVPLSASAAAVCARSQASLAPVQELVQIDRSKLS